MGERELSFAVRARERARISLMFVKPEILDHVPKQRITSPDPDYARKKRRDRLVALARYDPNTWVVGFEDET